MFAEYYVIVTEFKNGSSLFRKRLGKQDKAVRSSHTKTKMRKAFYLIAEYFGLEHMTDCNHLFETCLRVSLVICVTSEFSTKDAKKETFISDDHNNEDNVNSFEASNDRFGVSPCPMVFVIGVA